MQGKIVKLLGGFYYIKSGDKLIETRARGTFRYVKESPIVGDNVEFNYDDNTLGYIQKIYPRKNILTRPKVANVDLIVLFIPLKNPDYNLTLIDKTIVQIEMSNIDILIAINKADIDISKAENLQKIYNSCGFNTILISGKTGLNIDTLKEKLRGKTVAFAGVSGAGKSTISSLILDKKIESGEVSQKTGRGKHTTRHTELHYNSDYFIFDTPGFSSLDIKLDKKDLCHYFREFENYLGQCKFLNCNHINEPDCMIKRKVENGEIPISRYENYKYLYQELKNKEEY